MTWAAGIAIAGGILALGPIIIHIIFRRRYRVLEFAAMRFLLESLRRNKQRLRIEELIIIALRVLACLLIGFMLANIRATSLGAGSSAPTAHIFILDDSLSMGQQVGATFLYQKAVTDVAKRLEKMPDADLVAVISGSRPQNGSPLGRLAPAIDVKRDNFAARLASTKPSDLSLDLPGALKVAEDMVKAQQQIPVRVYLVSDFRLRDLTGGENAQAVQRAFGAFDPKTTQFLFMDFGLPCKNNLAVEKIALDRKVVVAGIDAPIRVTVRNTGSDPSEPTRLEAQTGEAKLPVPGVPALSPGQSVDLDFHCAFASAGAASIQVNLPPDGLPGDSALSLALDVRETVQGLIVDGSPNPGSPKSASFCLTYALDPSGKGQFGQRLEVRQADTWKPSSLEPYDFVILANVPDLPVGTDEAGKAVYPHVKALEDYVRKGGGLGIFMGDRVLPSFYNGPLYADGKGLLPMRLVDAPFPEPDQQKFVRLNPRSIRNEQMLRIFSGRSEKFSRMVRFYVFVPSSLPEVIPSEGIGAPKVMAAFDDKAGGAAVVRRTFGRGNVILWLTSADTKWSNWPKDLSFLPVMNDFAWELVRQVENVYDDIAGRRVSHALSSRLSEATSVLLKTPSYPSEDLQALPIHQDAGRGVVTYSDTAKAGIYELTVTLADRSQHKIMYSRRPDPRESDLVKATEAQIRAVVDHPFRYFGNMAIEAASDTETAPRKAFWWIFMIALLAALALESFLAQRFGHYQPRVKSALEQAT